MDIILIGHPGSQHIVPASKYLTDKYLKDFNVTFLNWDGPLHDWSQFVKAHVERTEGSQVILALDDYLVSGFHRDVYDELSKELKDRTVCVKLLATTPEEHEGYPVTTQYTLWDKEFLLSLLGHTSDPWNFEINGSNIFWQFNVKAHFTQRTAIEYDPHSCLSARWKGINWNGVKPDDMEYIINNHLV